MYPILIELGGFRLHSYGVVVLVAVLVALWVAGREARRRHLGSEIVSDLAVPVVLAGFVGARLAYVVGWEPDLLWRDPVGVLAVWRGGLALHGGLLGGFAAGLWFCRRRRVSPWRMGDAVAPALILAQGIGRLACLLSGDSYGTPSDLPWAITFTNPGALAPLGVPLHPTQLYEFGLDLGLFGLLWALRKRMTVDGQLFLLYAGGVRCDSAPDGDRPRRPGGAGDGPLAAAGGEPRADPRRRDRPGVADGGEAGIRPGVVKGSGSGPLRGADKKSAPGRPSSAFRHFV